MGFSSRLVLNFWSKSNILVNTYPLQLTSVWGVIKVLLHSYANALYLLLKRKKAEILQFPVLCQDRTKLLKNAWRRLPDLWCKCRLQKVLQFKNDKLLRAWLPVLLFDQNTENTSLCTTLWTVTGAARKKKKWKKKRGLKNWVPHKILSLETVSCLRWTSIFPIRNHELCHDRRIIQESTVTQLRIRSRAWS